MKKIICLLMAAVMLIPSAVFAAQLTDMPESHWAYSYVTALINDGTVNGFPDGSFKPEANVTRAEFVKMIGKSNETFSADFTDVPKDHWGYDYIMSSGMEIKGTSFNPDADMTRNDVAALVWKRAGAVKGMKAIPNATDGFTNKDAAAWVYNYGIMNGNDGINLRPDDGITRAEAAAIICRSRAINSASAKVNFVDKVSADTLKAVFNGSKLFDTPYSADKKITYGELARAGVRFTFNVDTPYFDSFSVITKFDSEYAREMYFMGNYCLGEQYISADYVGKNALASDAVAYFAFGCSQKTLRGINYGAKDNYYPEIAGASLTEAANMALTFAYNEGVSVYANGNINANSEITHKEMAALLIQFDHLVGIANSNFASNQAQTMMPAKISTDVAGYPTNSGDYALILEDIPNSVYEAAFVGAAGTPADCYKFVKDFNAIFSSFTKDLCLTAYNVTGAAVSIKVNPSMICKTKTGYALRGIVKVLSSDGPIKLSSIIPLADGVADREMVKGDFVYCDIDTGVDVRDAVILTNNSKITQVIQ